MNKTILRILIIAIFLASFAGVAMANPAGSDLRYHDGGSISQLALKPGDSITIDYAISGLVVGTENNQWTFVSTPATLFNPIIAGATVNDIQITYSKPTFTPKIDCSHVGDDYILQNGITIKNNGVEGQIYQITVHSKTVDGNQNTIDQATVYENIKSIPEFPTVAAPVAAILGLLFVIGHKRGNL